MEIINSYDKLPLGMYLDIYELCEDTTMDEDDRQMEIISILSGKTVDELLAMPIMEFRELARQTQFLKEDFPRGKSKVPSEFKCDEMVLKVTTDVTKMTTAQYVDFQQFSEMGRSKLVEMLSCFFIPKGKLYCRGYEVQDVQDVLRRRLMVTDAVSMSAFFFNRCRQLIAVTLIYSRWMAKKLKGEKRTEMMQRIDQLRTDLLNAGDGWTMCVQWWRLPMRHGTVSGQ